MLLLGIKLNGKNTSIFTKLQEKTSELFNLQGFIQVHLILLPSLQPRHQLKEKNLSQSILPLDQDLNLGSLEYSTEV
jgi:hypothetical protein